jgi:hypothetical protein
LKAFKKSRNYHFAIRSIFKPVHDHCVEPTLPKNRSESCSSIFPACCSIYSVEPSYNLNTCTNMHWETSKNSNLDIPSSEA